MRVGSRESEGGKDQAGERRRLRACRDTTRLEEALNVAVVVESDVLKSERRRKSVNLLEERWRREGLT